MAYVRDNGTVGILNATTGNITTVNATAVNTATVAPTSYIELTTGVASTAAAAEKAKITAKDSSVGSKATLDIRTEEVPVTESSTPDTTLAIWVNGVEYKLPLEAV